jgi:trigger factor
MQVKREQLGTTKVKLTITADEDVLNATKQHVVQELSRNVKVPGFRPGKAPANLVEKHIEPSVLQAEFLDHVINQLYVDAAQQEKLRPVAQPQITVTKFVPFSSLEFAAETEIVGQIKLPDYKKIKLAPKKVDITTKDVNEVIESLRERSAEKTEVERPAKTGDEVVIDFTGSDAKTGEPIAGADGKEYPLVLGSNTFIPGFEDELIGAKKGAVTSFTLTFPKDYGVAALQDRKVEFTVTVHKVQELQKPTLDDKFVASLGPFKTVADLKADVKKQLEAERQQEANRAYDNELLEKIAEKSTVAIPVSLVEEEINRLEEEEKRNLTYRGQTWQEHLAEEGITAEEHRAKQRSAAELRIKGGLILGEIAEHEGIVVTPEELEIRIMLLKNQYPDAAMQAEFDKPENRSDINSRLMTEKTLDKLRGYATQKA